MTTDTVAATALQCVKRYGQRSYGLRRATKNVDRRQAGMRTLLGSQSRYDSEYARTLLR